MRRRPINPAWGPAEIAVLGVLFIVTLWVVGPQVRTSRAALAGYWAAVAVFVAVIGWLSPITWHRDPPRLRGWGPRRRRDDPGAVRNAWPAYLAYTAAAAVVLLAGTAAHDRSFLARVSWPAVGAKLLIYLVYGSIQAIVFFGFVQTRIRTALTAAVGGGAATRVATTLATATLFAAAHAPNWPLAAMVFAVGLGWSWLHWSRPSVPLVGVSHAVLGTILQEVSHFYTRIGPFYAHPEGHIARYAIPGLRALVGDLF